MQSLKRHHSVLFAATTKHVQEILAQFHRSTIENIPAFSKCVWFGSISQRQRGRLDKVVKTASKSVGNALTSLTAIYNDRSPKELTVLSQTKLTPLIICSNYYKRFRSISKKTNSVSFQHFGGLVLFLMLECWCTCFQMADRKCWIKNFLLLWNRSLT